MVKANYLSKEKVRNGSVKIWKSGMVMVPTG